MDSLFLHPVGLAYISGMNITNCIEIELNTSSTDVTKSYNLGDYDCGAILPSYYSYHSANDFSVYGAAWFIPGITNGKLTFFGETFPSYSAEPTWVHHQNFTLYGSITTNSSTITIYWPQADSTSKRTFSGTLYAFKR